MVSNRSSRKTKATKAKSGGKGQKASRPRAIPRAVPQGANSNLGPRPKKPASGYNMFVRNRFATERAKTGGQRAGRTAAEIIRAAAAAWRHLSGVKRQEFAAKAQRRLSRYRKEIIPWAAAAAQQRREQELQRLAENESSAEEDVDDDDDDNDADDNEEMDE